MAEGYIYALLNTSMEGIVKIGKTTRSPRERAKELSTPTGVPTPFVLAYDWHTRNCGEAEKRIHKRLVAHRVTPDKEFFRVELKDITQIITDICSSIDEEVTREEEQLTAQHDQTESQQVERPTRKPPYARTNRSKRPYPMTATIQTNCSVCGVPFIVTVMRYEDKIRCTRGHLQVSGVKWD